MAVASLCLTASPEQKVMPALTAGGGLELGADPHPLLGLTPRNMRGYSAVTPLAQHQLSPQAAAAEPKLKLVLNSFEVPRCPH